MIPKILHYCWFGRNPLPENAKICIESWKRNCTDFKIIEWNEDNFDINSHQFVKECYEAKKYGFIVDVLRTYVLKEYGGIYLDTDTQIIKPFSDEFLRQNAFLCYEDNNYPNVGFIASEKNGKLVKQVYNLYKDKHFFTKDGQMNINYTGPVGFAEVIQKENIVLNGERQHIDGYVTLYPQEFFCAKSHLTGLNLVTQNTYAIHHYDASWHSNEQKIAFEKRQDINKLKEALKSFSDYEAFTLLRSILGISVISNIKFLGKYFLNKFLNIK